jgi:prepilin-type N-terminal cleavage/methylation domain-containing protein
LVAAKFREVRVGVGFVIGVSVEIVDGSRLRQSRGFSLIEILFVVALIGVLAGMAAGSIVTTRRSYQIYTAGVTFANRLSEARTHAIKRNRPIAVTLDGTAQTLTTTYTPPGGTPVRIAGPEYLPSGVVFDLNGAATLVVTFDSMGRPLNPPQTFTLRQTSTARTRTISVLSTGRVTVN